MESRLYGLDLFSGIGGNTLALRQWIKTIAYCEQDRHAQSVLLSRMADKRIESAPIWDDVSSLRGDMFDIPIDIIIAGFPCQDISVAGKGAGLAGERSGLFFEIMRLAKEIKPKFLFLENVPAIRTRGLDRVVEELTEAGYDCRWTMLSAADVGAKHKRERWFMLAYLRNHTVKHENKESFFFEGQDFKPAGMCSVQPLADTMCERLQIQQENRKYSDQKSTFTSCHWGKPKSDMGRVVDGLSTDVVESGHYYLDPSYWEKEPEGIPRVSQEKDQRVERIKRLGNAVVPLQAQTAFKYLMGIK